MPSSKDRRRIEVPTSLYERLKQYAEIEDRTITSVLFEVISLGLQHYQPLVIPRRYMDRFDEGARHALAYAKEALALNHDFIGTEHLLLGLLREPEDIAAEVLVRLWIDLEQVRAAVGQVMGRGNRLTGGDVEYTPRTQDAGPGHRGGAAPGARSCRHRASPVRIDPRRHRSGRRHPAELWRPCTGTRVYA